MQESLDAIRAVARKAGYGTRELFVQSTGFDWNELASAGGNLSLFADKQIIELRLPTGKPGVKGSAAIADFAANMGEDLLFIVSAPKLDRNAQKTKWVKALEANGGLIQIWPVDARELPGWINARMNQVGLQPDRDAVRLIADRVEGNLLAAQQEIEKLRAVAWRGTDYRRSGPMTQLQTRVGLMFTNWLMLLLVVMCARAIRILGGVRTEGVEPVIVMWALTRELRTLAGLADDVQTGADLGSAMQRAYVWKNRQGLVRACVSRHAPANFYRLLKLARQGDAAAKGQMRGDPWQLATQIILDLAVGQVRAA